MAPSCFREDIKMIRLTLVAVAMLIGVAPMARAATCREQMTEVEKLVDAAIDATKKADANKDLEKAREALKREDESGCITSTQGAKKRLLGD
jgi:hypothetical protein